MLLDHYTIYGYYKGINEYFLVAKVIHIEDAITTIEALKKAKPYMNYILDIDIEDEKGKTIK